MKEIDLYLPVKSYLEQLGYLVKSEVLDCDIVAVINEGEAHEQSLIVELKLSFSLALIHQGIERQRLLDTVYLAVPKPDSSIKRRNWRSKLKANTKLCRLLGLGLMTVDCKLPVEDAIEVIVEPAPYAPRKNKAKQQRLAKEFKHRVGDPNKGGVTQRKIVTAYRQNAMLIAFYLSEQEQTSLKEIKVISGIEKCASILQKNHYAWFERVAKGEYCLSDLGKSAVIENKDYILTLTSKLPTPEDSKNGSAS